MTTFAVKPAFIRTPAAVLVPGMAISFTAPSFRSVHGTVQHATKISATQIEVTLRPTGTLYDLTVHTLDADLLIVLHLDTMVNAFKDTVVCGCTGWDGCPDPSACGTPNGCHCGAY